MWGSLPANQGDRIIPYNSNLSCPALPDNCTCRHIVTFHGLFNHSQFPCCHIKSGWWFGTFFIFPYIGNNHPNWLIFFRGVETTNQKFFIYLYLTSKMPPSTEVAWGSALALSFLLGTASQTSGPGAAALWQCCGTRCDKLGTRGSHQLIPQGTEQVQRYMGLSTNGGIPKSSTEISFSIETIQLVGYLHFRKHSYGSLFNKRRIPKNCNGRNNDDPFFSHGWNTTVDPLKERIRFELNEFLSHFRFSSLKAGWLHQALGMDLSSPDPGMAGLIGSLHEMDSRW